MLRQFPVIMLCLCLSLAVSTGYAEESDIAYTAEVDTWHAQRLDGLRSETGWLTLVGLHPLVQGANILGTAESSDVLMTAASPAKLGTITLRGEQAEFQAAAGVVVTLLVAGTTDPAAFSGGTIRTDGQGAADKLVHGTLVFYVIQRGDKHFLRVKDRASATLRDFQGIERYPVDKAWRITARLEGGPGTIQMANVLGQVMAEPSPGTLVFEVAGETCRLQATAEPGESLFIVFGDGTTGHGTYPGGRFLVTEPPAADGTVVLDFNRAYNPPCVFSDFATCPLPSPQNMLGVAITAGEKMWGAGH